MPWPKGVNNFEALRKKRLKKIGEKFGSLTIISEGKRKKGLYTFNCICDCGHHKNDTRYGDLKDGRSKCQKCKEEKIKEDFYSDEKVKKRILENIKKTETGCWEWQRRVNRLGYGQIKYRQTSHPTHRISYKVFKKEIPKGFCACHTCDNRKCVNPDHIWIGSHKDNARDRVEKGRSNHYKKTMSINEVLEIRKLYPGISIRDLSIKFNRSDRCIRDIVNWKTWT